MIGLIFEVSKDRLTDKEMETNKQEQKHTDSSKQKKIKKSPNKCAPSIFRICLI